MRIHLGHHFYGAGNLGDDFMLAGFLTAMRRFAPQASFTSCVPFSLEPLRRRFPAIEWRPCEPSERERSIDACDVWLGLGGSPFQSAQNRWFIDHLAGDAALCSRSRKPMFYLGVGVQTDDELAVPEVRDLCAQASGIWTRDADSASRLAAMPKPPRLVTAAADLAHLFFRESPPPPAAAGRLTLVPNFDYATWPGQDAALHATDSLAATDQVWLAQESRELPGAERALHAALPETQRPRWRLVAPEEPGAPLDSVLARWPSGESLISARYHAALAGAWAGSRIVVIGTNEKLRAVARELDAPQIAPDADSDAVARALASARPATPPLRAVDLAEAACAAFLRAAA